MPPLTEARNRKRITTASSSAKRLPPAVWNIRWSFYTQYLARSLHLIYCLSSGCMAHAGYSSHDIRQNVGKFSLTSYTAPSYAR